MNDLQSWLYKFGCACLLGIWVHNLCGPYDEVSILRNTGIICDCRWILPGRSLVFSGKGPGPDRFRTSGPNSCSNGTSSKELS